MILKDALVCYVTWHRGIKVPIRIMMQIADLELEDFPKFSARVLYNHISLQIKR